MYIDDWPTGDRPTTDPSFRKFQMAISPQPVVRSTSSFVLRWVFRGRWTNGAISANLMYGQFTCLRRQHHITSLLMRKTLELDFVWEGSLRYVGYTLSRQEIKLQLLTGTIVSWIYFLLNQIQKAASSHLGKLQMNTGLSLEYVIWSIITRAALQEYGIEYARGVIRLVTI